MRAEIRRDIDEFNANAKNRTKEEKDKKGMAILVKQAKLGDEKAMAVIIAKTLSSLL